MTPSSRLAAIQNLQASHDMIATLEDSKASIERLVDEMPHALFVFDSEGRIHKANWEACRLLGVEHESYIDYKLFAIFDRESMHIIEQKMTHAIHDPLSFEVAHEFELSAQTRSGQSLPYLWALRPLSPRDFQRLPLFVLYGRNLTDVRTFDLELSRIYSNISLGILTIDSEGLVEPHYSRYCEYLLQMPNVSGMNNGFARLPYEDLLFRSEYLTAEDNESARLVRRALGESEHWFEATKGQFPQLVQRRLDGSGSSLWIKIDYYPISRNGVVQKILLILENRTEIVSERQERSRWIRRNEAAVRRILEVQNADPLHIDTVCADLKELTQALDADLEKGDLDAFRRRLPNLRLAAAHGELRTLEEMVEILAISLNNRGRDGERENLMRGYAPIRSEASELLRIYSTLSQEPYSPTRIDPALSHAFGTAIDQALANLKKGELPKTKKILMDLKKSLLTINHTNVSSLEAYLTDLATVRAAQEGKLARIYFEWDAVALPLPQLKRLREVLALLVEQSLGNGLEKPMRRRNLGKPEKGQIIIQAKKKAGSVHFVLSDDGRGISVGFLREVFAMRKVATAGTLARMSDAQIMNLIFDAEFVKNSFSASGFSANLGKVSLFLQRMGAQDVKMSSTLGRGVTLEFRLELEAKA